jgi:hypothetical protein
MSQRGTGPGPDGHEAFDELAVGWALHALEPEDEVFFAAHLLDCARCARTVAETAEVMGALASDLPPAEPGDGLRERLRAAVEETEQVSPSSIQPPADAPAGPPAVSRPEPAAPRGTAGATGASGFPGYRAPTPAPGDPALRPAWRRVLPNALAAAAVAAILALGTWNVLLSDAREVAETSAAQQSAVVDSLLEPGTATIAPLSGDGEQVATVVARDAQVQVVTQGLPVNDQESQTYVVWGMSDESPPVPLGTFDVVRSRTDVRTVGSSSTGLDGYGGYAISLESGREAPSAPTDIVATG